MESLNAEVVFSSPDRSVSRAIARATAAGRLRKLFSGIYTSNMTDPPEQIVSRNLYPILGKLYPGAVLSHRTALEGKPSDDGTVFLTYRYTRKILLHGLKIRLLAGQGPLSDDMPFAGGLHMSSIPRAYLENCMLCRRRSTDAKCVSRAALEERLDRLAQVRGEGALNKIRDRAREITGQLGMDREFGRLDKIISTLLGTRKGAISAAGKARALGIPYDQTRLPMFDKLFAALRGTDLPLVRQPAMGSDAERNLAFFESYFSNFIEGTEFDIPVARDIVFRNIIPPARPRDAHDIIGTFRIVSNRSEMFKVPASADELVELLKSRHFALLESRPEAMPGQFKEEVNRAGQTTFVAPELVRGTLLKGMDPYWALEPGPARAIYMLFLVSEIHPFTDGNGRVSRIMMNSELVSAGLARVIIPIVFRGDYLQALRALSRTQNPEPLIRVSMFAQRFTSLIDFSDFDRAHAVLQRCNAFSDDQHARLLLPAGETITPAPSTPAQ